MSSLPQHLDLHLIRILYLLLVEKNVSRVALKLNQPQPSISASLRKLRELTGDPILVRGARGMVPTQHGESLLLPAKRTAALLRLAVLLHRAHEDDPIPTLELSVDGNALSLVLDKTFIDARPLLRADLVGEAEGMAGLGISFRPFVA